MFGFAGASEHHSHPLRQFFEVLISIALLLPTGLLAQKANEHQVQNQLKQVEHIIVIYQENWSFDSLYGLFPGANGLFQAASQSLTQRDRLTGQPYSSQLGQPFDLVSGSVALTTPPQPINTTSVRQLRTRVSIRTSTACFHTTSSIRAR